MKVWVVMPHDGFSRPNLRELRVLTKEPDVGIRDDVFLWVFNVETED